ncbi:MAG TPA: hypothetical protein VF789_24980 [Thermoanaerobaculia bacterium]
MDTPARNRLVTLLINHQSLILILVCFASLALLIRQNRLVHGQLAACVVREKAVADKLQLSRDLMQLVGAPVPFASRLREAEGAAAPAGDRIVVVFNPTTCGQGLRGHLSTIRVLQERLGSEHVAFLGLVGADTREDQTYTLNLRNSKLMTFPFSYVRSRELARFFPLEAETGFSETPIYLWVDRDFRIKSVFRPDSIEPEGLERWLEARTAA